MSEEIIKILDAVGEKFGIAVDWTSENVMPYLQQLCGKYIKYEIATSILWMVIGLILIIIGIYCVKKTKDNYEKWDEDFDLLMYFICAFLFIVGIPIVICQMFDIVTCLTFPEKMLIEEMQSIYRQLR